jgi:UDP:flavonoid glycosyltransferase YjiC (YdhE family)
MTGPVLFIVSGVGLGNSTRCSAVIDELVALGHAVEVVTAGAGARYFGGDARLTALHMFEPLCYAAASSGAISVRRTLSALPGLLAAYARNVRSLARLLKRRAYSAIVIDSDYSVAPLKRWLGAPVIAINNASQCFAEPSRLLRLPPGAVPQLLFEALDCAFHRLVPDRVICPSLAAAAGKPGSSERVAFVPPIVRAARSWARAPRGGGRKRVLIVPGGSRFGQRLVGWQDVHAWPDVEVRALDPARCLADSRALMPRCDVLVINGGFSSVSEAVVYGKPCVVVPLEGHAEQHLNALAIERLGLGRRATARDWHARLREVLGSYDETVAAHRRFAARDDGARLAAQAVAAAIAGRGCT